MRVRGIYLEAIVSSNFPPKWSLLVLQGILAVKTALIKTKKGREILCIGSAPSSSQVNS